jgi:hypothetical protein
MVVNVPKLIAAYYTEVPDPLGPALASALEVLAAHRVEVMIARGDEYTPAPAVSHAILTYNRRRKTGLADGIVISRHTIRHMTAGSNTIPQTTHRHDYLDAYITYY